MLAGLPSARGWPATFFSDVVTSSSHPGSTSRARVLFDDDRRVQLTRVTTATRFPLLQAGRVDLVIATVTATPERRGLGELSDPCFMSGSLVPVPRTR